MRGSDAASKELLLAPIVRAAESGLVAERAEVRPADAAVPPALAMPADLPAAPDEPEAAIDAVRKPALRIADRPDRPDLAVRRGCFEYIPSRPWQRSKGVQPADGIDICKCWFSWHCPFSFCCRKGTSARCFGALQQPDVTCFSIRSLILLKSRILAYCFAC